MSRDVEASPRHSGKSSIASSFVLIGSFALFAAAMKVGQDVAIAWRHGSSLDGFWFVISMLAWPVSLAMSMFTIVVVPVQFRASFGLGAEKSEANSFGSEVLGTVLALTAVITVLVWLALHAVLSGPWSGLSDASLALAKRSVDVLVLTVPLGILAAMFSARLTIHGSRMPTLIEAMPALAVICAVTAWGGDALLYGVLIGSTAMCLAMTTLAGKHKLFDRPRLGFQSEGWKVIRNSFWIVFAGQALMACVPIIDQMFAAKLGESVASHVSYASRLITGIQAIVGIVVQRACLNALARHALTVHGAPKRPGQPAALAPADRRWSWIAFSAGALMTVLLFVFARDLVELLLSRGRFTEADEAAVISLVKAGAVQMPFYLGGVVLVAAAALRIDHAVFFWAPLLGIGLKALCATVLLPHIGAGAIPLSTAVLYAVTGVMLFARSPDKTRAR